MASAKENLHHIEALLKQLVGCGELAEQTAEQMKAARQEVDKAILRVGIIGGRAELSYEKLDRAINSETQRSSRWTLYQVAVIGGFIGGLVVYMLFKLGSFDEHKQACRMRRIAAAAAHQPRGNASLR